MTTTITKIKTRPSSLRQSTGWQLNIPFAFGNLYAGQLLHLTDIADEWPGSKLEVAGSQTIRLSIPRAAATKGIIGQLQSKGMGYLPEAAGNIGVYLSLLAGIHPQEAFDATPDAYEVFRYFLRQPPEPASQRLDIAFFAITDEAAPAFDLGFIPEVCNGEQGFRLIRGNAELETVIRFLPDDRLLPLLEAIVQLTARFGVSLGQLFRGVGMKDTFELVFAHIKKLNCQAYKIARFAKEQQALEMKKINLPLAGNEKPEGYDRWVATNVIAQKQAGYYAVQLHWPKDLVDPAIARKVVALIRQSASEELRLMPGNGFLLRFVPEQTLPGLYAQLQQTGLID